MSRATRPLQALDAMGRVIPYDQNDSKMRIVYATDTLRFYGVARPNMDEDVAGWRVYQETVNNSGDTIAIDWANGNNDYNQIYDDSTAKVINAITQASPGKVTTTTDHGYSTGDLINIEDVEGMTELNGNFYTVTVVDGTNFTIGEDTTGYTAYTANGESYKRTYANYDFS